LAIEAAADGDHDGAATWRRIITAVVQHTARTAALNRNAPETVEAASIGVYS
jgi:hypothetical protein